MKRKKKRKKT